MVERQPPKLRVAGSIPAALAKPGDVSQPPTKSWFTTIRLFRGLDCSGFFAAETPKTEVELLVAFAGRIGLCYSSFTISN